MLRSPASGLTTSPDRPLSQTSYGERRRVEIAMALAQSPQAAAAGRAFAGLSIDERRDVQELLRGMPREMTIVMIEHNMDVALDFAERITLLHFGEVIVEGTRAEVVADPARGRFILANRRAPPARIDAFYGDSQVLQSVSFSLGEGRLLGLLGRNGAGKSTCMNVTVGLLPPRDGEIEVFGTPVTRLAPEADCRARRGAGSARPARLQKPHRAREPGRCGAQAAAGSRTRTWTVDTVFANVPTT